MILFRDLPGGPIMDPKAKLRSFKPKTGESYGRIEAPKGELGFYILSRGGGTPYRLKIRGPSFVNLSIVPHLLPGHLMKPVDEILLILFDAVPFENQRAGQMMAPPEQRPESELIRPVEMLGIIEILIGKRFEMLAFDELMRARSEPRRRH